MPNSKVYKENFIKKLGELYDLTLIRDNNIVSVNSKAILYIRYSKNLLKSQSNAVKETYWFGITQTEYEKYKEENLFLVCICAAKKEIYNIIISKAKFEIIKKHMEIKTGQWKFNIDHVSPDKFILNISGGKQWDVSGFLNNYNFGATPKYDKR
ncbi:MAG: hypothetical protein JSU85_13850 [Candidatus Zixiibacteriota bacterium]|nr:MAG: hypothetical protein JSU85_13850 [candidate division Zixibacteria bacterium]